MQSLIPTRKLKLATALALRNWTHLRRTKKIVLILAGVPIYLATSSVPSAHADTSLPGEQSNISQLTFSPSSDHREVSRALQGLIEQLCRNSGEKRLTIKKNSILLLANKVVIPSGCNNLEIDGANSVFRASPDNLSDPALLTASGVDGLTIQRITFDGSLDSKNEHGLVRLFAPMRGLTIKKFSFKDQALGSGIWLVGSPPVKAALAATSKSGDKLLRLDGQIPAGLQLGSSLVSSNASPGNYISAINRSDGVITLAHPLQDTILLRKRVLFSPGLTASSDVDAGQIVIPSNDIQGIKPHFTLWAPSNCIPPDDRVVSIARTGSFSGNLTLEMPVVCKIRSGDPLSGAAGFDHLTVSEGRFSDLGQALKFRKRISYELAEDVDAGSKEMTFRCVTKNCERGIGLIPGQKLSSGDNSSPLSSAEILSRSVNNSRGTYSVVLSSEARNKIAAGTNMTWQAPAGGNGYGVWSAYGAWFANRDAMFKNLQFSRVWSAPLYLANFEKLEIAGAIANEEFKEFQSPTVAPSPCWNVSASIDVQMLNDTCTGATGDGLEFDHNLETKIVGGNYSENGLSGMFFCGGDNLYIGGGVTLKNNNQIIVNQMSQVPSKSEEPSAIVISGTCNFSQPSLPVHVSLGKITLSDDQNIPTQTCGVRISNHNKGNARTVLIQGESAILCSENRKP